MGRRVNQRFGDYDNDATVLLRVVKAVEDDTTVTEHWRKRVAGNLRDIINDLLTVDKIPTSMGRSRGGRE